VSPNQFKLALLGLLLGSAVVGGGVVYLLKPSAQAGSPGAVALPSAAKGTPSGWFARVSNVAGDGLPGVNNGRRTRFADPFGVVLR